jgi:hypothetical protein
MDEGVKFAQRPISIKAVIVGVLFAIGGSLILGVGLGIFILIFVSALVPANAVEAKFQEVTESTMFGIVCLMIGFGLTTAGGFIGGWIAKRSEVKNGGLVGFFSVVLGIPFYLDNPLWYNAFAFGGAVPFGMLGGYFAKPRRSML